MRVRQASLDDARSIARVHVEAWRAAYRDLMPDAVLDEFAGSATDRASRSAALDAREARWRDNLVKTAPDRRTAVCEKEGSIVGFATAGPGRASPIHGEIWAIYAAPDAWGQGVGRALLDDGLAFLAARGFDAIELWVLEGNLRAIRFYEIAGFRFDGAKKTEDGLPHLRMTRPITWSSASGA
jgi:ribosomal protein S18 acetylase RimI-like enzyme